MDGIVRYRLNYLDYWINEVDNLDYYLIGKYSKTNVLYIIHKSDETGLNDLINELEEFYDLFVSEN